MSTLRISCCIAALVAAVAMPCGAARAQVADTTAGRRTGVRIPREVAGFMLRDRRDDPDPRMGVTLRYQGPDSLIADVFLYPGPGFDAACDSTCAAGVLAREVAGFRDDFPEMLRRGYYRTIEVTSDSALAPPAGAAWRVGRRVRLRVSQDKSDVDRSDYVLFYLPGYRVKIRATYRATPERLRALDALAGALVPALTLPPG